MIKFSSGLTRVSLLALALGLSACANRNSGDEFPGGIVPPADQLYATAVGQLQTRYYAKAAKSFDAIQENYPYSTWSTHAELLVGYAQYKNQDYTDAISSLNRFIQLHPENQDTAYAYYLKSLCYYEQIDDVQRDQSATYLAISALDDVVARYPDTAYARDARIKLRLANNRLAGHDMVIARYYEKQHLYAAAVGRYQDVIDNFQTTTDVPEALERLVEVYLDLGLTDEAVRTASVLGYNYPGSDWYEAAYDKLKDHGLANNTVQAQAAEGTEAATPKPSGHHWYWPF